MNRPTLLAALWLALFALRCSDPVAPEFQPLGEIYLLDGFIADQPGFSRVRLSRSEQLRRRAEERPVRDAAVVSRSEDGQETRWAYRDDGAYYPPDDFRARTGQTYQLTATLADGTVFTSAAETVPAPPRLTEARVRFDPEAYFDEGRDRFVPAFYLLVDIDDPAGERNYYRFNYRSWEREFFCRSCQRGRLRNGVCEPFPRNRATWDYFCDGDCFRRGGNDGLGFFDDTFGDGKLLTDLEVARVDHYRPNGGLLLEAQVFATTAGSLDYARDRAALANDGGGLDAAVPGVLRTNVSSTDPARFALGYVAAAAVVTRRVYLDRADFAPSLPFFDPSNPEPCNGPSCPPVAPCVGPGRIDFVPAGWEE